MRSDQQIFDSSNTIGYSGGGYYNPILDFKIHAQPLKSRRLCEILERSKMNIHDAEVPTYNISSLYRELEALRSLDSILFGLYNKGSKYEFAVWITNEERLMDFEVQIDSGHLGRTGFYEISRKLAEIGLFQDFELE